VSWPSAALGDLCDIEIGKTPSRAEPSYWRDGTLPWLSIADMNQGRQLTSTKECITDAGARAANMKLVKPGTLLLSYKLSIGKVGVAQVPLYTNEAIAALSNLRKSVDPNFMYWALQHVDLLRGADRAAMGATLNKAKLKEIRFPVPPLVEQRRIAAVLDKADALRAKRRETIAKLDQLLQSVFLDMFGEPIANPKGWTQVQLMELGRIQTGATPPTAEDGMFDGTVPFVTPGDLGSTINVSRRSLTVAGASKSRLAPAGSALVCCIGATIGKMGYAQMECAFNQQINAITWGDEVKSKYGYHALKFFAEEIAHQGSSTTMPILKKSAFERLKLPVPPIGLQEDFERVVSKIESQQHRALCALRQSDGLFASLQWECFSGGARHGR
jgi:type I restriction enzyme S subunit